MTDTYTESHAPQGQAPESQNRDDGGRYAGTDERFGQAYELEKSGWREMPEAPQEKPDEFGSDRSGLQDAAQELTEKRLEADEPATYERKYLDKGGTGDPIDENEAVSIERAADDLTRVRGAEKAEAEQAAIDEAARHVDSLRGHSLIAEIEADVAAEARQKGPEAEAQPEAQPEAQDGLDPKLQEAMKHPQVREALEQEFGKYQEIQQRADTALQNGNFLAQSMLAVQFPELLGSDPVAAFNQMAATNPQRAQACLQVLNAGAQIEAQQQQAAQQQAQQRHQEFEAQRQQYSKQADEALGPMTFAQRAEMVEELVNYVGELGITREQLVHEAGTNLALNHPAFQKMAADALKYQRLMRAPKSLPYRNLPPVQRPGVAADRGSRGAAMVSELNSKFKSNPTLKNAAALRAAQRKS